MSDIDEMVKKMEETNRKDDSSVKGDGVHPYVDIIITVYHNETWSEMFQFDYDGVDNLDTAVAQLVRETQLNQKTRDKTKPVN